MVCEKQREYSREAAVVVCEKQREDAREVYANGRVEACADLVAWEVYCRGSCEAHTEDQKDEEAALSA